MATRPTLDFRLRLSLWGSAISWSSKCQSVIALSFTEAEHIQTECVRSHGSETYRAKFSCRTFCDGEAFGLLRTGHQLLSTMLLQVQILEFTIEIEQRSHGPGGRA